MPKPIFCSFYICFECSSAFFSNLKMNTLNEQLIQAISNMEQTIKYLELVNRRIMSDASKKRIVIDTNENIPFLIDR